MILFPLRPVSLMHKKCQGHKIIYSWHESIDQSEDVFVEYPVHVNSVADLAAVVQRGVFLLVFAVLYN